jgi:hypothetical protein
MQLQHVNLKLLVNDLGDLGHPGRSGEADLEPLIPIFHSWIQEQPLGELLLDVADYRHVCAGPGVILIGHEGDYSVDNTGNRLGIRYNRKAVLDGGNQDRLQQAARAALTACQRLEADPRLGGKLRFSGQEIDLFINDRLLAPNRTATREAARPDLETFFRKLFRGSEYSLSFSSDPRGPFAVSVKTSHTFSAADLLANLDS